MDSMPPGQRPRIGYKRYHEYGNEKCPDCVEEWPQPHTCGGLAHGEELGRDSVIEFCERCGGPL